MISLDGQHQVKLNAAFHTDLFVLVRAVCLGTELGVAHLQATCTDHHLKGIIVAVHNAYQPLEQGPRVVKDSFHNERRTDHIFGIRISLVSCEWRPDYLTSYPRQGDP